MGENNEPVYSCEDYGIDWLAGKYTGKKERLRRELRRLESGSDPL